MSEPINKIWSFDDFDTLVEIANTVLEIKNKCECEIEIINEELISLTAIKVNKTRVNDLNRQRQIYKEILDLIGDDGILSG